MARLSTHVLDTSRGVPAGGDSGRAAFCRRRPATAARHVVTNADGRTDAPLLAGERLEVGVYELTFRTRAISRARARR